ncbi:MAG: response regulator [Treponema sp.]|nr:response regulator [Treponema sp.]
MGNILRKRLVDNAKTVLNSLETSIKTDLLEPRTVLGNFSETVRSMILQGSNAAMLQAYIKEITGYILADDDDEELSGFSGIYGYFDVSGGVFLDSLDRIPPESYVPTERPWYKEAVAARGSIVFLPPYADVATVSIVITYARALFDNEGRLLGAIALDLEINRIGKYIAGANLGTMGYGFLLSEDMVILSHFNSEFLGRNIGEVSAGSAALENKLKQEHTVNEYRMNNFEGNPSIFFVRQLKNGWYIGIVTPRGEYYRELGMMRLILIISGTLLASVLSAILFNIVRQGKKTEEHMRIMFDATPLCANFWDINYRNIDCNQEAVRLFGLSNKQEYLQRFEELSPKYQPDGNRSSEKALELVKKAFAKGYCRFEWIHRKLDGDLIPCEVTLIRVKYKEGFIVLGYTRDLREYKAMLSKLHDESEKFRSIAHWYKSILNAIPLPITVTDTDSNWTFINTAVEKFLEITLQDAEGKPCSNWGATICNTPDCGIACAKRGLNQTFFSEGDSSYQVDVAILKDLKNKTMGYVEVVQDVTNLKLMAKKQVDAENANRAKTAFLAKVSHEIRTPMNAILGITEMQLWNEDLPQDTQNALSKINNSGYLLLGIINDILDLSKIEAGKMELVPVEYDVPSLINDTVQLNIMRYDSKPINFNLMVDENIPLMLFGDELRIKQILNNLLSNAFKYTDEGEILLSFHAEQSEPEKERRINLVFSVSDTGHGMTAEQVRTVFDEYTRFNSEANRTTQGTGLGMNITNHLVNMMDGKISVKSKPGKGTTVTVYLPQKVTGNEVLGKEITENLKQFRGSRSRQPQKGPQVVFEYMPYGKVLIVDDVETNLYVATGLMAPYGLSLETVTNGFDAISKIERGCIYDIIFMDHFMPKMDGIETTKKLREMGYTNPIIALTANALAGQAEVFMENGFDGFISKPIDLRQLNALLNKLIRDKHPPEEVEAARLQAAAIKKPVKENTPPSSDPKLKAVFARDAENALERLEAIHANEYRRSDDIRQFVIAVHSMKSALANIGETELSAAAYKLEQSGRSENMPVIMAHTPAFLEALREVIEKSKPKEDDGNTIQEAAYNDWAYLSEKLGAVHRACEEYDEMTANSILAELEQKNWPHSIKKHLDTIAKHLLHSDFDEAANAAKDVGLPGFEPGTYGL